MTEIWLPEGTERAEHFRAKAVDDLAMIEPWLPERPGTVLDIGCGLALIDVLLARRWPDARFYLLDGDGTGEKHHGYNREPTKPWGDTDLALSIMRENGAYKVMPASWMPSQIDLIISIISWGFHYPIDTYLDEVLELLRPGGRLILDLRHGRGGREVIERDLRFVGEVRRKKSMRTCFEKPA